MRRHSSESCLGFRTCFGASHLVLGCDAADPLRNILLLQKIREEMNNRPGITLFERSCRRQRKPEPQAPGHMISTRGDITRHKLWKKKSVRCKLRHFGQMCTQGSEVIRRSRVKRVSSHDYFRFRTKNYFRGLHACDLEDTYIRQRSFKLGAATLSGVSPAERNGQETCRTNH